MGFNSVYRALQEVFPEVDARLLKAVAIEHSKDADAAVEAILIEVIPYLSKRSTAPSSDANEFNLDAKVAVEDKGVTSGADDAFFADSKCLDEMLNDSSYYDAYDGHKIDCANEGIISLESCEESRINDDAASSSTSMAHDDAYYADHADQLCDQLCRNTENEEIILAGKCQDSGAKIGTDDLREMAATTAHRSGTQQGNCIINGCINNNLSAQLEECEGPSDYNTNTSVYGESHHQQSSLDGHSQELVPVVERTPPLLPEPTPSVCETLEPCDSSDAMYKEKSSGGTQEDFEDESALNTIATRSAQLEECDGPSDYNTNTSAYGESHHQQSSLNGNSQELVPVVELAPPLVPELTPSACETLEPCDSSDAMYKEKSSGGTPENFEDESALNTIATRSGQICRIDHLENIIEEARCNKKILFTAMESVLGLMKEVELQESAAEQAKEEAASGGLEILSRVEDLKKMLSHAKEANDMHAGEVYGEKAILGTEARELQSRLLNLSDERDKSLAILEEMHKSIESRLAAAEIERKAAEQEKQEKEECARKALALQELVMDKVVEESKILKQEAEENSKLREFLMDRGHVVDMLQGEISVICQDVKLLKEKFDDRVPLSKSLSSSQTSCILASSSSSLKSMLADQIPEQLLADLSQSENNLKKTTSLSASMDEEHFFYGEETTTKYDDNKEALGDDDWEMFDNRDIYKM